MDYRNVWRIKIYIDSELSFETRSLVEGQKSGVLNLFVYYLFMEVNILCRGKQSGVLNLLLYFLIFLVFIWDIYIIAFNIGLD